MSIMKINERFYYDENNIIGKGASGVIYQGIDLKTQLKVAIKVDEKIKNNKREFTYYNLIKTKNSLAKAIDYFELNNISYLIIKLYGSNCEKIRKKFNENDIKILGIQILEQLKNIHELGIIHNDVKPDNIIFDDEEHNFKLIDFGFSKLFIINGIHIKFQKEKLIEGTFRYLSLNIHNKISSSRRDDLISLSYTLIYLCKKMYWSYKGGKKYVRKIDRFNKFGENKKKFHDDIDKYNIPDIFKFLYKYSNNLGFYETPDYKMIINKFKNNLTTYEWNWRKT